MSAAAQVTVPKASVRIKSPPQLTAVRTALGLAELRPGTVLVEGSAPLPKGLNIRFKHLLGWKSPDRLDGFGFERLLRAMGWNYFFIVPARKVLAVARSRERALRKAIASAMKSVTREELNSLEVAEVTVRKWFGLHFVRMQVYGRHVRESPFLREPPRFAVAPRIWEFRRIFRNLNRKNPQWKAM